jgi:hypothetical protein
MLVPVMHIGIVRVSVFERLVDVGVRVRLSSIPFGVMLMLMVFIMNVRVFVLYPAVVMQMLMVLGQMQPHPGAHQ